MFRKFGLENSINGNLATGLEIILLANGAYAINVVTLKRNKSNVSIESKSSGNTDIAALSKIINPKSPVVLVINGKGIIHRKVSIPENDAWSTLLSKVLPNANPNEFYIQKQDVNSSQVFVSVVRANVIDEIVDELKENNINNITACFLGSFVVNNILTLINKNSISNEFLIFSTHKLLVREDKIHEVSSLDNAVLDTVNVGDELLEGNLLIAYAAALSFFIGGDKGIANSEAITSLQENFKEKQKFHFFGWMLLIATFVILIANYFVFDHYWGKSRDINSRLVLNQSALKKYEALKIEYSQKKEFLEQNGLLENSRTSFFADRLAASIPFSIQLLDCYIYPLKKKKADDLTNAFYFDNKTIRISGTCNRNTELNDWMKTLKENHWIANINLLNYKQDNAKEAGLFFLEIKLK